MSDTLVWISGATAGLGSGFAPTCPHPDARFINLSRSEHPDMPIDLVVHHRVQDHPIERQRACVIRDQ